MPHFSFILLLPVILLFVLGIAWRRAHFLQYARPLMKVCLEQEEFGAVPWSESDLRTRAYLEGDLERKYTMSLSYFLGVAERRKWIEQASFLSRSWRLTEEGKKHFTNHTRS